MRLAHTLASTASNSARIAEEKATRLNAYNNAKVKRRRDEVGELTMQLCQKASFASARLNMIAAVHATLVSRKARADRLIEMLKIKPRSVPDMRAVGKYQRARLDIHSARTAKPRDCRDEMTTSNALFSEKLLHIQKHLTAAFEKVIASSMCVVPETNN